MRSIHGSVTARQASTESATPQLAVVPKPRPYFVRVRNVKAGSPRNKAVLVALGSFANPDSGACWPSIPSLVTATELDRSSVCRALNALERDGLISRQRSTGGRATTRYRLNLPPAVAGCDPSSRRVRPQQSQGATLAVAGCHPKSKCEESPEESRERRAPPPVPPPPPRGTTTTPAVSSLSTEHSGMLICPKCERSWPVNSKAGDVCFNCCTSITVIQRRLDEAGKYKDVPIRIINEDKKVQEQRIDYKEKCVERERIAEAKRVEEQRIEQERRDQETRPRISSRAGTRGGRAGTHGRRSTQDEDGGVASQAQRGGQFERFPLCVEAAEWTESNTQSLRISGVHQALVDMFRACRRSKAAAMHRRWCCRGEAC